ncbi:hypothetical protein [Sandarakinorhabdus sp.]|uniref:hypothetical protein n=1 Tax=Sandarakinorhabdus sp. TaxID=1916663 RepID=UPI00286D7DDF|nr:hypothetical protein [Sandarakinorhabdus sp.]
MSAPAAMIARDPANTDATDFTPTPEPVARAMVALEPWGPRVWEPACGDGALSGQFLRAGIDVVETDLAPRGVGSRLDFLHARHLLAPEICTNPPYRDGLTDAFAAKALELGARRVMLLMPLGWMQAVQAPRPQLLRRGLARVWVSSRRIAFKRGGWDEGQGGGSMHKHALYVWEAGYAGDPVLKFFDWREWE